MLNKKNKSKTSAKKCQQCFSLVRASSRKCKYCGYKFESNSKYLVNKIKSILRIDRAYQVDSTKNRRSGSSEMFFTIQEIEALIKLDKIEIPVFLTLDDITMLDETSLLELGRMLSRIGTSIE